MQLCAGQLSLQYQDGNIRNITYGNTEIIRMIYFAVRDENWRTVPMKIISNEIDKKDDCFRIKLECEFDESNIQMRWRAEITGSSDGTILFKINGQALNTFKKNRTGLCVLHPVEENLGQEVEITTPEKEKYLSNFPVSISPYQPFTNIAAIRWKVADQCSAMLRFSGDIFETEDQRNWTDNSFKTYCTPLSLPFPATLQKGDIVEQTVILSIAERNLPPHEKSEVIRINYDLTQRQGIPFIGITQTSKKSDNYNQGLRRLSEFHFDHYRADIKLNERDLQQQLQEAIEESYVLQAPLELALFVDDRCQDAFASFCNFSFSLADVKQIILLSGDKKCIDKNVLDTYFNLLKKSFPKILIGGGTDYYFAELNRSGLDASNLDFVSYSINPQVHAEDNETLIENMQAQADTVVSAKQLFGKAVYVSPITLKMRYNADATDKTTTSAIEPDDRQHTAFGAAWTLGSLKHLIESGAESITYYEAVGLKGLLDFQNNKPLLFPLAYVLKLVLDKQFKHNIKSHCSHPFEVTSLILTSDNQQKIIIANYTNKNLDISIFIFNVKHVHMLTDKGFELVSNYCCLDNILQIGSNQILVITSSLQPEK